MTGSVVIAMVIIWVLAMVGGFFTLRKLWRKKQADLQRKLVGAVDRVSAEGKRQNWRS